MATHSERVESNPLEWDMEFKDPFSLEEDQLPVTTYCSGSVNQPSVLATNHLAVEAQNDCLLQRGSTVVAGSLQTFSSATMGAELPKLKENAQHYVSPREGTACSSSTASVVGNKRTQNVNEPSVSYDKNQCGDTVMELNCRETATCEEQSPIPVMLSSAKRFCASEDIQTSESAEQGSTYFMVPSPTAILSNSSVHFAQPMYRLPSHNIPAWPTVSPPLRLSNSGIGLQIQPVLPYDNRAPYSAVLSHSSNIPVLCNQSLINVATAGRWPRVNLHLQNVVSKPVPSLPRVNCSPVLGQPSSDFAVLETVPVPQFQNGLTSPKLPLAAVSQVVPPFRLPVINRLPFSTSSQPILPQQRQPHSAVPALDKSSLPSISIVNVSAGQVMPNCDSVVAQQPVPLSSNMDVGTNLLSSDLPEYNNNNSITEQCHNRRLMQNDRTLLHSDQSRHTLSSVVACTELPVSVTSSESASKQTVTLSTSCQNIPLPLQTKFSSTCAPLDPRIRNGNQQNNGAGAQFQSSAGAASTPSSAFVVPVPPPLPSLEELIAESSEDPQKDDKTAVVYSTSESTASATTESAKLKGVIITSDCFTDIMC